MRSSRRSVRTWLFGALAGGTTLAVSVFYAYAHGVLTSANAGRFGPRFLIAELGVYLLWVLLVGVVFIAFDFRHRDVRARMAEALDVRPVSNISTIAGRILGVVATVALPVVGTVVVLQVLGTLARALDFWMGDPIEPVSLASFVLLDVLVATSVWCAIVALLSSVLRNRLGVLLGSAFLLVVQFWAMATVPVYLLPAVSVVASTGAWASDITVQFADLDRVVQRCVVLVLGAGVCILAAAVHPRADGGSRLVRSVVGVGIVLVASGGLGIVALRCMGTVDQRDEWLMAHRAAAATEANNRLDVEKVTGSVHIDPGAGLEVEIDLHVRPGPATRLFVFSFNPGMRVVTLSVEDDEAAYTHESGLLTVVAPAGMAERSSVVMSLRAEGVPDPDFGYLDSAVDWRRRPATNLIRYLGTQASLFHRNYVALTPAVHWLPAVGPNIDREDPSRRTPDFFDVDLVVEIPRGWSVAGPGRQPQAEGMPTRHRFRPSSPIQDVALFAAEFERRAVDVQGIELELLVTPQHLRILDYYAEAGEEITSQLFDLFAQLEDRGLSYPERILSLVEVPTSLRTYRGGWRLDALRAPGTLLLREEGLPTIRTGYADRFMTGERSQVLASGLIVFFLNDWLGGNAFQGLADNLLASTSPSGPGAVALDAMTRDLAYRALNPWGSARSVWFTAHEYDTDAYFGTSLWEMVAGLTTGHFGDMVWRTVERPVPWNDAARTSLAQLDGWTEPHRAFGLMSLKATAMEGIILGEAGVEGTTALLGRLRRSHWGRPFAAEDFAALAGEAKAGLDGVVENGLHGMGLPGFLASPATVARLAGDDTGGPRYHLSVHVFNGEPVAGWIRLAQYDMVWGVGEPIRVPGNSAVEVGMIFDEPPRQIWLHPYLSLNRGPIRPALVDAGRHPSADVDGFVGTRRSDWIPPTVDGIVVDDLDPGFSWSAPDRSSGWDLIDHYRGWSETLDHGLPVRAREAGAWTRRNVASAWGSYRRTVAVASPGKGDSRVFFTAELAAGRWRLDYYLPHRRIFERWEGDGERAMYRSLGSMAMRLVADGEPGSSRMPAEEWNVDFDAGLGVAGWNKLGEFDLPGGEVRLEVSNRTTGEEVIADAILWRQAD